MTRLLILDPFSNNSLVAIYWASFPSYMRRILSRRFPNMLIKESPCVSS
jgi:hypothetical protein